MGFLSHELEHLYFQYNKENILTTVLPLMRKELIEIIRNEGQVENTFMIKILS